MAVELTPDEWIQIRKAFDQLVDLDPPIRTIRLGALGLQGRLRDEVASLLEASDGEGFLDKGADRALAEATAAYSSLRSGEETGAFVVDSLIGRGGVGEVYLAHRRDSAFEQSVAVKLLRPEAVDRIELFDRERRVLASLEHPGIARLVDGGIAQDGRAFMAMEYVDGEDIVSWCRTRSADLDDRLDLFAQVCDAVAYAHRRLVVHRDIKPSNILIDREGRARLLDFGLARILEASAEGQTGTLPMLTPEYAAPEQLENRAPTTATDIYSLGAVLFELLTGRGAWRFDDAPLPVVLRRLLHDDPPAPSKVAAETLKPPVPARQIGGDLDAIVLKAMRRNPAERYDSVSALAEDIARHRTSLPVKARAGKGLYLARRFVRRHRWGVAASAAGLFAVLVGASGVAWQARATAVERDIARAEAARAEAVNQSLTLMFRNASESGRGGSVTAKELLAASSAQLLQHIDPNDPDQAAVALSMAELYILIDDPAAAGVLLEQAIAKGVGRSDPVALARLKQQLAGPKSATGSYDEARRLMADADKVWATDPARYRAERLEAVSVEASIRRQTGDRDGAIKMLTDSLPEAEIAYAGEGRELLTRYSNLLLHLVESNRLAEAEGVLARADAIAKRTKTERTSPALNLILMRGAIASRRGDVASAEQYIRQVAKLRRELYGPSTSLAMDLMNLGKIVMARGRPDEALDLIDEAYALSARNLGPTALPTMLVGLAKVDALCALGRPDEAEPILADVRPIVRTVGPKSLPAGLYHRGWAYVRIKQGRKAEADAELSRAEAVFKAQGTAGVPHLTDTKTLRAML